MAGTAQIPMILVVNRPHHHASQLVLHRPLGLDANRLLVVVAPPLVSLHRVRRLGRIVPALVPATLAELRADLVVHHQTRLPRPRTSRAGTNGRRANTVLPRVRQRERLRIEADAHEQLLRTGTGPDPCVHRRLDVEVRRTGAAVAQRTVVAGEAAAAGGEIVRHQVDVVQVRVHRRHIVAGADHRRVGADGHRQQVARSETLATLAQEVDVGDVVVRIDGTVAVRIARRVLPVEVEAVKVPLHHEVVHVVHQTGAQRRIVHDARVPDVALVPAAHRDEHLQVRPALAQVDETLQGAALDLVPVVQDANGGIVVQADERVRDVRATVDVDVLDIERTVVRTVDGPAAEVAEDFVCAKRMQKWRGG